MVTLRKNFRRDIRGSLSRFISILAITALGAGFFSGLRATGPDMYRTADAYYANSNLMDYRILSSLGFTEDDVEALRAMNGVEAVMPAQRVDALIESPLGETAMRIHSLPADAEPDAAANMNRLVLLEGRLPESTDECVVGGAFFGSDARFKIGDTLTITPDNTAATKDIFAKKELTVVGLVQSPLYVSKIIGNTTIGNGTLYNFVFLPIEAFDLDVYTELYVKATGTAGLSAFSEEYESRIDDGIGDIESLGDERVAIRYEDIYSEAEQQLNDAQLEFERQKSAGDQQLNSARQQISAAEQQIAAGEAGLAAAQAEIDSNAAALAGVKTQIDEGQIQLAAAKAQLDPKQQQYDAEYATYSQSLAAYTQNRADFDSAYTQMSALQAAAADAGVSASFAAMDAALADLAAPGAAESFSGASSSLIGLVQAAANATTLSADVVSTTLNAYLNGVLAAANAAAAANDLQGVYTALSDGLRVPQPSLYSLTGLSAIQLYARGALAELEALRPELDAAKQELDSAKLLLDEAKAGLDAGWAEYNQKSADLAAAQAQYDSGMAALGAARSELASYRQQLADARTQLASAKNEYYSARAEAQIELKKAQAELFEARNKMRELETPKWYVYGRDNVSGYTGFSSDADRIGAIATFIPIFFFLVAALVSLTTMTRMVEEQRLQIGALKALGFSKFSIAIKYVSYAALASTIGAVGGVVVGLIVFPTTVWNAYRILYQMSDILLGGNAGIIALSLVVSILSTTLAAFAACYGSLAAVPAQLMRPKAPKAGKRVLLERIPFLWNRIKFSNKVTIRNLFLNKKRFFMTIVGVLGCTALLLTGLGINDAITGIAPRQFGEIELHDATLSLYSATSSADDSSLNRYLSGVGDALYYETVDVGVSSDKVAKTPLDVSLYIPEDAQRLNDYIHFAERKSGEEIEFPQGDGVILTEKLANKLEVSVGDTIEVTTLETDGSDKQATLTVAGIMENYVYHLIYITPESYKALFGAEPAYNLAAVRFDSADEADISGYIKDIMTDQNVMSAMDVAVMRDNVGDMLDSLNAIVLLIIVSAGLLAIVVLYNLTNINITERVREIATLKVLGFYQKEVDNYIFRENRALTIIGILLGLVGGYYLAQFVITTAEVNEVMFQRTIQPLSYACAIGFTLLSSELVNLIMRKNLRRIDMVESLKSAE